VALTDSLDKIIQSYFTAVSRETFTYKGVTYTPQDLVVSPMILRGFTCPAHCGGCCPRFSLDYLPDEPHPYKLHARLVPFNHRSVVIYSDLQDYHNDYHCTNLNRVDARCLIHARNPFSCDFELIRFLHYQTGPNRLTQKLFGRGWAMKRSDGERGALCEMLPVDDYTISEVLRKLRRLKQWIEYFQLAHCVDEVVAWVEGGTCNSPLLIPAKRS
jgi:hypothetical protein